jgi:hypothetical protein
MCRINRMQNQPFGRPREEELLPHLLTRVKTGLTALAVEVKRHYGSCGQPIHDGIVRIVFAIGVDELAYRFRPASEFGKLWGEVEALIENADGRMLIPFEGENGEPFGLRAGEVVVEFEPDERKVFEVIKAMWPPERGRKKMLPDLVKECEISTKDPWRRLGSLKDSANKKIGWLPPDLLNLQLSLGGSNSPKNTGKNAWLTWVNRP